MSGVCSRVMSSPEKIALKNKKVFLYLLLSSDARLAEQCFNLSAVGWFHFF